MDETIKLGTVSRKYANDEIAGLTLHLTKHSWDCGWYWGFGYVGNRNLHTHFKECFLDNTSFTDTEVGMIFDETNINQEEWWILRDLFVSAYALKEAAAIYHYQGHQTYKVFDVLDIRNKRTEAKLNKDLKTVLDKIWDICQGAETRSKIVEQMVRDTK